MYEAVLGHVEKYGLGMVESIEVTRARSGAATGGRLTRGVDPDV